MKYQETKLVYSGNNTIYNLMISIGDVYLSYCRICLEELEHGIFDMVVFTYILLKMP